MAKVKSLAELKKMKEKLQSGLDVREKSQHPEKVAQIKVAMATCGIASGAKEIYDEFIQELDNQAIEGIVTQTGCMGYCYAEPTVEVKVPGMETVVYGHVDKKKVKEIVERHLKQGEYVDGIIPVNYQTINDRSEKSEESKENQ